MLRVGLSGGIGSGKSTAAKRFAQLGAVVIDADHLAREVVAPGSVGLTELATVFGDEILTSTGELDRAKLGEIVFSDSSARAELNAIIHPKVFARRAELVAELSDDAIVIHDIPLLAESDSSAQFHAVIIVQASIAQRLDRLAKSRGMSEADARRRISAQADDQSRAAIADLIIDNSASTAELHDQVDASWQTWLVPFESNIRHGRAAIAKPDVVDYQPKWSHQASLLAARIQAIVGEYPVEHIGFTAVVGLPAADLIELQIGVNSVAQAHTAADSLAAAGFPRLPLTRQSSDLPALTGSISNLGRQLPAHGNADPKRPAVVAIQLIDSAEWAWGLAVRNWLVHDSRARSDYQDLVAHGPRRASQEIAQWLARGAARINSFVP